MFLVSAVLSFLSSCEKASGPTAVSGLVVDKDTGQPVPQAEVQVHAFSSGNGSSGGGYGPALGGPYLADAQGQFSFSFEASKGKSYRLDAYGPLGHFSVDQGVEVDNGQANRNLRIPVQAPGWVRVRLVDETPTANQGQVIVGGFGNPVYSSGLPLKEDEIFVRYIGAHIPSRISWIIKDYVQGTVVEGHQDLTIPSLYTITVTIRF